MGLQSCWRSWEGESTFGSPRGPIVNETSQPSVLCELVVIPSAVLAGATSSQRISV